MKAIEEINKLVTQYDFPLAALLDVNHRLECCEDEHYINQQLRYLQNLIKYGFATKKD